MIDAMKKGTAVYKLIQVYFLIHALAL